MHLRNLSYKNFNIFKHLQIDGKKSIFLFLFLFVLFFPVSARLYGFRFVILSIFSIIVFLKEYKNNFHADKIEASYFAIIIFVSFSSFWAINYYYTFYFVFVFAIILNSF